MRATVAHRNDGDGEVGCGVLLDRLARLLHLPQQRLKDPPDGVHALLKICTRLYLRAMCDACVRALVR